MYKEDRTQKKNILHTILPATSFSDL